MKTTDIQGFSNSFLVTFLLTIVLGLVLFPASAASSVTFDPVAQAQSVSTACVLNFSVSVIDASDIIWIQDGSIVKQNPSSTASSYSFSEEEAAIYILTAVVYGTDDTWTKMWEVNVTPAFNVSFSPVENIVTSRLDRAPEFSVNISEGSDIRWYLDDELLNTYEDVNHSSYTPVLSETGNYSIQVHASNANGTVRDQWYWIATSTPAQIMSGGSGGGSSSSSVLSGEDFENIRLKDVRMQVVNKDSTTKYLFPAEENPVDSIEFRSDINAGYVKTTIEVLKSASSSVSKKPEDDVYSYVNIVLGKKGLESKLGDTRIIFHVNRSWIDENEIDVDSVRLNLFSGSDWKRFPVKILYENEDDITFVSTTTEFGCFTITGQSNGNPEDDIVVIDMGGNAMAEISSDDEPNGASGTDEVSGEDVWSSVLRSMTDIFIKRNPLNN